MCAGSEAPAITHSLFRLRALPSEQGLTPRSYYCVVPENIHTSPTEGFLFCIPSPARNSSSASYFTSKILAF